MARNRFILALSGGAVAVAMGVAAGSTVASATVEPPERVLHDVFRTNDEGLTYGSLAGRTDSEAPDLVLVEMEDGSEGYVRSADLFAAEGHIPTSPEEAIASQEAQRTDESPTLTVFAADGTTIIGEWSLNGGVDDTYSD